MKNLKERLEKLWMELNTLPIHNNNELENQVMEYKFEIEELLRQLD